MDQLARITSVEALALSPEESRTFPRWYTDLLLRKRSDMVTIGDVASFVDNFGVSEADKAAITTVFGEKLVNLDPPQFYIYLRLTGHILQGKQVRKELAFVAAPVPKPKSILSRKTVNRDQSNKNEMDSFMSLMTGKGGSVRKRKRVTFDSKPPQITEAAHRSMSELLRQAQLQEHYNLPTINIKPPSTLPSISNHDKTNVTNEPEPDQPISNNQFAHVNIESVLHNGQSMLPTHPGLGDKSSRAGDSFIQQLTQSTSQQSSDQSSYLSSQLNELNVAENHQFLSPQVSGSQQTNALTTHTTLHSNGVGPQANSADQWQSTFWQQPAQHQQPVQKLGPQSTGSLPLSMHTQANGLLPQLSGMNPQHSGLQPQLSGLQPQLSGLQPQLSGLQPQFSGIRQFPGVLPQSTGIQPQTSGLQSQTTRMQPQVSGMQAHLLGMQPQIAGMQSQQLQLQQQHQQQQHPAIHPQLTGMQALAPSQMPSMYPQAGYAPNPGQQNGFLTQQPLEQNQSPGMQFIKSVQAPQ